MCRGDNMCTYGFGKGRESGRTLDRGCEQTQTRICGSDNGDLSACAVRFG